MAAADETGLATHGHFFVKKALHKPVYCHHCTDMLWGIIQPGFICEVCNFVIHDRCIKTLVTPCISIAASLVKNPVAHCWSEQGHFKRKFCNVCRKRLDDTWAMRCEICEYYIHVDCQDFAIANCLECAIYVPDRQPGTVIHHHHWREGNLQSNSKCFICKKSCWSTECLAGFRCEWCGMTAHAACHRNAPVECRFGLVEPIMLHPQAVSIPRTEIPMEAMLGIQTRRKDTISRKLARSISEDFSSCDLRYKDDEGCRGEKNKEKEERDEVEIIKVFDGNCSLRRRMFRTANVSRNANYETVLAAAMKAFHIKSDPAQYFLSDAYTAEETELCDPFPVQNLSRREGKRPAVFLRFKDQGNESGVIDIHAGKLNFIDGPRSISVTSETRVCDIIPQALRLFGLNADRWADYQLYEVAMDTGAERLMTFDEQPWELLKQISKDSIRQMALTRFYMHHRQDPHGNNIALFVGNLPPNLSQRQYEQILLDFLGKDNKFKSIGPIYYEYGSMVITYEESTEAVKAFYSLRDSSIEDKSLMVLMLPNITPHMIPPKVKPLLVFVNVKSGGCQGLELISSFRKLLNPHQVYDLDNGGPLPGLYVFRHIEDYRILVCGGDGTIGWVLQCLDNVGQDSECSSPPCAIVPLGTGNDLARVLHWGTGYTGGEDPLSLLRDIIEAEEIRLDRWTVVFHTEEKMEDRPIPNSVVAQSVGTTNEDNTQIFVMNNYFGIGIDADLCLDFHNAREENPNKFNSRLHNKGVYVKMGLRKMVSRKLCKDLHRRIKLEVDGKIVDLPPIEGIIILNILSWGSGANPWGPEKEDNFSKPNHWDGMLEVVGVTGVVHLGQIQSGLRSAIRIAQGGHIKIKLLSEVPVQVDGEPWIQPNGEVVVLKSALKATMLKKMKGKPVRRRNTEPSMLPVGSTTPLSSSSAVALSLHSDAAATGVTDTF